MSEAPLLDEREEDRTKTSNSNHEPFSAIGKNSLFSIFRVIFML
jgi:hypothetical protein